MSGGSEEGTTLEYTPTWVVAAVCTIIVALSLAAERLLHCAGVYLKKKNQKPLYEALQKVKEELMLLGFISLLLTVFQNVVIKICVPKRFVTHLLPCKLPHGDEEGASTTPTSHFQAFFSSTIAGTTRRLLSEESLPEQQIGYCNRKHKVPLLSLEALHHLHIFIFILAIVHVTFCVLTILFAGAKIRQWKHWEDSIAKGNYDPGQVLKSKVTHVHQHAFIKDHFLGIGKNSALLGWLVRLELQMSKMILYGFVSLILGVGKMLQSFLKQFYASVTKADYVTLRLGFIMTHCRGSPKFNFHKYMIRALEDDFKTVVGISWYLWVFVVIFLLLNVNGWHMYFWIAFIPFILLLAVGTKLEHVITQLAQEVAEKHIAIEGELVVQPSDEHFWFGQPQIVLFLIHFILFQNAFEIAFFFWIWVQYSFDSCIMGHVRFIVPRLIIGVFIQVLCSYSTLPLYAIVTQMGSSYKKAIFNERMQGGLIGWAEKVKEKKGLTSSSEASGSGTGQATSNNGSTLGIQLGRMLHKASSQEIQPAMASDGSK